MWTELALDSLTEKSSNKSYSLDEIELYHFLRVRKSTSKPTAAKSDNMKLYFMSRKKTIPIHIFQKLVVKGFSVIEKPAAMATTQIRSLTDLDTPVPLVFSFLFVANTDIPRIYHFKPLTLVYKLLKPYTHFYIIFGHMLTSTVEFCRLYKWKIGFQSLATEKKFAVYNKCDVVNLLRQLQMKIKE